MDAETVEVVIPLVSKLFACVECKFYSRNEFSESWCAKWRSPVGEVALTCKPKKSWRRK
jgi:hypothetical protein